MLLKRCQSPKFIFISFFSSSTLHWANTRPFMFAWVKTETKCSGVLSSCWFPVGCGEAALRAAVPLHAVQWAAPQPHRPPDLFLVSSISVKQSTLQDQPASHMFPPALSWVATKPLILLFKSEKLWLWTWVEAGREKDFYLVSVSVAHKPKWRLCV